MNAEAMANLTKLLAALIPLGMQVAETIHPLSGSGHAKLATATTLVQTGIGLAVAAGAVPSAAATAVDIAGQISAAVAQANASGGVPKLPVQ